jgi:heme/copper-type cytochrome/quinol oxidase subunit 3
MEKVAAFFGFYRMACVSPPLLKIGYPHACPQYLSFFINLAYSKTSRLILTSLTQGLAEVGYRSSMVNKSNAWILIQLLQQKTEKGSISRD